MGVDEANTLPFCFSTFTVFRIAHNHLEFSTPQEGPCRHLYIDEATIQKWKNRYGIAMLPRLCCTNGSEGAGRGVA